jgi:hypothetical protein
LREIRHQTAVEPVAQTLVSASFARENGEAVAFGWHGALAKIRIAPSVRLKTRRQRQHNLQSQPVGNEH